MEEYITCIGEEKYACKNEKNRKAVDLIRTFVIPVTYFETFWFK